MMQPSADIRFAARMLDAADEGEADENLVAGADAGDMEGVDANEAAQGGSHAALAEGGDEQSAEAADKPDSTSQGS